MSPRSRRSPSYLPWVILLFLAALGLLAVAFYAPVLAGQSYGSPSSSLNTWQRFSYAVSLLWNAGDLTVPNAPYAPEQMFVIEQGETVSSISQRLEQMSLIKSANTFRIYLLWSGMDTTIRAGTYRLSAGQTAIEIADALQVAAPTDAILVVLSGWRMEEIAASLPTSGLEISPEAFLAAAASVPASFPDLMPAGANAEGFLYPDTYVLPRSTTADQLISLMLQNFSLHLTAELREGFSHQGLDVYRAVILASIIEREAVVDDEMPKIASVFFNRLAIGMTLGSDPTVQYALGYNSAQQTWWTNPLNAVDLQIDSPYNTRLYSGLPPGPISNPGLAALKAVAFPEQTPYYYFNARCDGSGLHTFSETLEQFLQSLCP